MNPKHHFGKICDKHPELKGERISSNSACIACHAVKAAVHKKRKYWSDDDHRKSVIQKVVANKAKRRLADPQYLEKVNDYTKQRYFLRLNRVPPWADQVEIRKIYKEARAKGMTVDHIIPLRGELVSGLHVHNNLQLLPTSANSSKGNKFEVN